jgi:hypothetical protein
MQLFTRRTILAGAVIAALGLGAVPPAFAQSMSNQHVSNGNIWHVRHRLEADIDQLKNDDRDYGGHRVKAIERLNAAHNELLQAEESEHHRPVAPGSGVGPNGPVERGQGGSNKNIWYVRRNVEHLIAQLQNDERDYGGHRVIAIQDMQGGRMELLAAERFARAHGN